MFCCVAAFLGRAREPWSFPVQSAEVYGIWYGMISPYPTNTLSLTADNLRKVHFPVHKELMDTDGGVITAMAGETLAEASAAAADTTITVSLPQTKMQSEQQHQKDDQLSERRRARFGSVRVAWHRMTLGENPGGSKNGPPVMLAWDGEGADRFESVDKYSERIHGDGEASDRKKPIYRMSKIVRREIALKNHTEDEIAQVEKEVLSIREGRKQSSRELEEGSIKGIIQQKRKEADEKKKGKTKSGIFAFLKRKPRS